MNKTKPLVEEHKLARVDVWVIEPPFSRDGGHFLHVHLALYHARCL